MPSFASKTAAHRSQAPADKEILNGAHEAVRELAEDGRHILHRAGETSQRVRNLLHTSLDRTQDLGHEVEAHVKAHPVRSSLVALASGFLLGALLSPRG